MTTAALLEPQATVAFDALRYIASYADLRAAFGLDTVAATAHYNNVGRFEGRVLSFDALRYTASYPDLIAAFGTDTTAATRHYMSACSHRAGVSTNLSSGPRKQPPQMSVN